MTIVLGLDGSMTAFGWAALRLGESHELDEPVGLGCVRTSKEAAARHVYMADDDGRRLDEIADVLIAAVQLYEPRLIVIEAPAGAQHANSAKALGLSYGLSRTLARCFDVPCITVQAEEPRRVLVGRRNASKTEMEDWCLSRWPTSLGLLRPKASKPEREGAFDALTVAATGARSAVAGPLRPQRKAIVRASWDPTEPSQG